VLRDLELTLDAVDSWLELGRDVVIRGDDGSGRSTVLRGLAERLSGRDAHPVLIRAAGPADRAALLTHPSWPTPVRGGSGGDPSRWLTDELSADGATLLLDDAAALDAGTMQTVHQVLTEVGCRVVSTAGGRRRDPHGLPMIAALLADRAPADVWLRPMSYSSVLQQVTEHLGAPPAAPLLASIAARSAGNPRVIDVLIDAALHAGAIELRDGRWQAVTSVTSLPTDGVANAFLPRLTREETDALEFLSWLGPVPDRLAEHVVDPLLLSELTERGRVIGSPLRLGAGQLAVSPPALAAALRAGLTGRRRIEFAERAQAVDPRYGRTRAGERSTLDDLLTPSAADPGSGAIWVAQLAAQIEEHEVAQEAALRAAWSAAPGVHTANAYLAVLSRRPVAGEFAEVYRTTAVSPQDDPIDRALYRLRFLIHTRWSGGGRAEVDRLTAEHREDLAPLIEAEEYRHRVFELARAGRPVDPLVESLPVDGTDSRIAVLTAVLAGALIDVGRPDLALPLAERGELTGPPGVLGHFLSGLRATALLLLGDWDEVERQSRARLEAAAEELDADGVRVHACLLAEVLSLTGRPDVAWVAVSLALRCGTAGPAEQPFFLRALALAASLQVQLGDQSTAENLLAELRAAPVRFHPLLDPLLPLAEALVAHGATDVDAAAVDDELWAEGLRRAERGQVGVALECWLRRPARYTAEQLTVIEQHLDRVSMPMLAPWFRLHRAFADDDRPGMHAALAEVPPAAELAVVVRGVLGLTESVPDAVTQLSERQRDVVELVRAGADDEAVAAGLFMSVTSARMHLDRALSTLGLPDREALIRAELP